MGPVSVAGELWIPDGNFQSGILYGVKGGGGKQPGAGRSGTVIH